MPGFVMVKLVITMTTSQVRGPSLRCPEPGPGKTGSNYCAAVWLASLNVPSRGFSVPEIALWRERISVLEIALWREGISVAPFMGTPRGGPGSRRTRTDQLKWRKRFRASALQVRIHESLPGLSGQAASKDVGSVGVPNR